MRHLTENEVAQFYAAYRAMEATASSLRNEVEWLRLNVEVERGRADEVAHGYYKATVQYTIQRNFPFFVVLVTLYFGLVFYLFYLALA